jgi:hypothetical protein
VICWWQKKAAAWYDANCVLSGGGIMKNCVRTTLALFLLTALAIAVMASPKIDPGILGTWGKNSKVNYEFKADGTFILEGMSTYKFDAIEGIWHYWWEADPKSAVTAEYKLSADKATLQINMKKGKTLKKFVRIK